MPNEKKINIVKNIEQKINDSIAIYFTKYTGMNVIQATKLRREFREKSVEYKISKNTLTKIAAINAGYDSEKINEIFQGQIGIAYTNADPTAPAKVIKEFVKDNKDCLEVVGLIFEGEFFEADKYKELANLGSKEELLTKLVSGLNSPMTNFASTINSMMVKLVIAFDAVKSKK